MKQVPFPSVTVCLQKSEKWMAMIEALNHFDIEDEVFDLIRNQNETIKDFFSGSITKLMKSAYKSDPKWNSDLIEFLDLNQEEVELMYLLSYASFELKLANPIIHDYIVGLFLSDVYEIKYDLVLKKTSKNEHNQILKSFICDYNGVSCPFIDEESWFDCKESMMQNYDGNYKLWCTDASNFNPDPQSLWGKNWMNTITKLKIIDLHLTKRNLIEISLSVLLDDSYRSLDITKIIHEDNFEKFDKAFANYFQNISPLKSSNATLLDIWQILNPAKNEDLPSFETLTNDTVRLSLHDCLENESASSCHKIEMIEKEVEKITGLKAKFMKLFNQPEIDSFIPLCNFGTDNLHLKPCNKFKYAASTFKKEKCFTFNQHGNEKLIDFKLGPNAGLNLMVNFEHLGNDKDQFQPAKIFLHEPEVYPDLNHIKNDYFILDPGQIVTLKAKPTKIDTTLDFKKMGFSKRRCKVQPSHEPKYNEINCLMDKIYNDSTAECGCEPWILQEPSKDCNFTGLACFQNKFRNHITNHSKFEVFLTMHPDLYEEK